MNDDVYYRLIRATRDDIDQIVIATLQWFDEHDYDHKRYLTHQKFETEEDALEFAKETYANPSIAQHIKDLLKPLIESDICVD